MLTVVLPQVYVKKSKHGYSICDNENGKYPYSKDRVKIMRKHVY